jgi:histidinol dehydrogenase
VTRPDPIDALPQVAEIVTDVRDRGDAALVEWCERLGEAPPVSIRVPAYEIASAETDPELIASVRRLADAVSAVHAAQRPDDTECEPFDGVCVARRHVPLGSVGVYVPGGQAAYVSSLVMAAVPARVAGVDRIAVASPHPREPLLAAARELEIDEVYAFGGAQAVAALAYGTESVPRVDKIVGPGNIWVTAAKLLVSGTVGIDLPAGPSEVMVVADETADPELCAVDLLAQAEHGADSTCILVTTSEALAEGVGRLVSGSSQVQLELVATLDEALQRANSYAPEHLELHVADPDAAAGKVVNAGAVFIGPYAPAVLGDYAAGSNHVLPTGGLARSVGGLGLESFLKPLQVVSATRSGLASTRATVAAFSEAERLPLHAVAVEARFRETA